MNNSDKIEPVVGMWFQSRSHVERHGWLGACVITEVTDRLVKYYWKDSPDFADGNSDRPLDLFLKQVKEGEWITTMPKEHYIKRFKELYDTKPSAGSN